MFIHQWDAGSDDEWRPWIEEHRFGELVAGGIGRDVPVVVPTQFVIAGGSVLVHLLRPNPVWEAIEENPNVLLAVSGDWAFVPSSWKAIGDEDPLAGIPTTYYASVQIVGVARPLDSPDDIAVVLRQQLAVFQPEIEVDDPAEHGTQLRAIRAMIIEITQVRSKFKYGGNVDAAHRIEVAGRLEQRGGPGDLAAAAQVRRRLGGSPG